MIRKDDVWIEGTTQRVRRQGMVIVTTKPATIRVAYGNERVRELQERRDRLDVAADGRLRRLVSRLVPKGKADPAPVRCETPARESAPETVSPPPVEAARKRVPSDSPVLRRIGESWKTYLQQRHTLGADHPMTAITMHRLACLCRDADRFDDAAKWFQRAHSVWTKHLGSDHPCVAENLREWAELMGRQGFDTEATRLRGLAQTILGQTRVA